MDRVIIAHTPLGPESLLFKSLTGTEELSHLYHFDIELLSPYPDLDLKSLLGQSITIESRSNPVAPRYFNGIITKITRHGREKEGDRYHVYRAVLCPDLWLLTQNRDFHIWQEKNITEIISSVLNELQIKFENKLTESYRAWEYCVQYNESDFEFISRLMEHEGIYYYFEHKLGEQVLILIDSPDEHQPLSGYEDIPWTMQSGDSIVKKEGIYRWQVTDSLTPALYTHDDYDFRKPHAILLEARQNPQSYIKKKSNMYEWPGRYVEPSDGQFYTKVRQQELGAHHEIMSGDSTAPGIAPGYKFNFIKTANYQYNGEYLTVKAHYFLTENHYASSGNEQAEHHIQFEVIKSDINWRPPRITPWPRTFGPQTAKVVGRPGKQIDTDNYGRVKVKFHWDQYSTDDGNSSCWIRVSSAWAGMKFGGIQIPRVGEEVVVDFVNGDPDRPIITGRVYNEANMPAWNLPGDATKMGFVSRSATSSTSGTDDNASQWYIDDTQGKEVFRVHAEKNYQHSVEKHYSEEVKGSRSSMVYNNSINHTLGYNYNNTLLDSIKMSGGDDYTNITGSVITHAKGNNWNASEGDKREITASNYGQYVSKNSYRVIDDSESVLINNKLKLWVSGKNQEETNNTTENSNKSIWTGLHDNISNQVTSLNKISETGIYSDLNKDNEIFHNEASASIISGKNILNEAKNNQIKSLEDSDKKYNDELEQQTETITIGADKGDIKISAKDGNILIEAIGDNATITIKAKEKIALSAPNMNHTAKYKQTNAITEVASAYGSTQTATGASVAVTGASFDFKAMALDTKLSSFGVTAIKFDTTGAKFTKDGWEYKKVETMSISEAGITMINNDILVLGELLKEKRQESENSADSRDQDMTL